MITERCIAKTVTLGFDPRSDVPDFLSVSAEPFETVVGGLSYSSTRTPCAYYAASVGGAGTDGLAITSIGVHPAVAFFHAGAAGTGACSLNRSAVFDVTTGTYRSISELGQAELVESFSIDWGDGSEREFITDFTGATSHTYADPGSYLMSALLSLTVELGARLSAGMECSALVPIPS